jgi:hypothetical protein
VAAANAKALAIRMPVAERLIVEPTVVSPNIKPDDGLMNAPN